MMRGLDQEEDGATETAFRDTFLLCLCGFICVVILLLPHLNPPGSNQDDDAQLPGNISVELFWDNERIDDLDLWVEAPGDIPVGYSNKSGAVFNLLRDDLGNRSDSSGLNFETAYSRGIPEGEYTVNVHWYRGEPPPITARVIIKMKAGPNSPMSEILVSDVELTAVGQEITVVRFALNGTPALVPGSVHNLQRNLRTAR